MDDFCATPEYDALIQAFRAKQRTARAIADDLAERDEMYHAYTWYLIALDLGEDVEDVEDVEDDEDGEDGEDGEDVEDGEDGEDGEDVADMIEGLETAEQVCDEDRYLAHLQVALWFARGIHVASDPVRAFGHLETAAFPFLELPPMEEIRDAPDVGAARDAAWAKALRDFGFPADGKGTATHVTTILDRILAATTWPATLDVTRPLGPSYPDRPYWLHPRHEVSE
jgi:hypothetical protein